MTGTITPKRALARRGVVAIAALALAGTSGPASVAAANESSDETSAVEACKAATQRSAEAFENLGPLSGQGHASRVLRESKGKRKSKGKTKGKSNGKGKGKGNGKGNGHRHAKHVSHKASVTVPGWSTVLTDSIDSYTMVLLVNSEGRNDCMVGPNASEVGAMGGSGGGEENAEVGADQVGAFDLGLTRTRDSKPFSDVEGRAGSAVSAVRFTLTDGSHVSAEVAHGWFLAFWEGAEHATTIEVASAGGTSTKGFYWPSAN